MEITRSEDFAMNMTIAFEDIELFNLAMPMLWQMRSGRHLYERGNNPCFVIYEQLFNMDALFYLLPSAFIRADGKES